MRNSARSLLSLGLLGLAALSMAQLPGTPAPKIEVKKWVKGTAVESFDPAKIYVVEFWATWCGPCKVSIPHITELAKKNTDVTFVGVSIWEDDKDDIVSKFVTSMGDKMAYNVAYGGNQDGMAKTWMTAAGQNGIPTAFIVKGGTVQWLGHPMEMEEPLAKVKAGTLDVAAEAAKITKAAEDVKKQEAAAAKLAEADKLYGAGKKAEAKAILAELKKGASPELAGPIGSIEFGWTAQDDPKAFSAKVDQIVKAKDESGIDTLMGFASANMAAPTRKPSVVKAIGGALSLAPAGDVIIHFQAAMMYLQLAKPVEAKSAITSALAALPKSQFKDNAGAKNALNKLKDQIDAAQPKAAAKPAAKSAGKSAPKKG